MIVLNIGDEQTVSAKKIIGRALSRLGVTTPSEAVPAEDAQYAFDALNEMVSEWAVQSLMVQSIQRYPLVLVPGQSTYTIGFDGDVNIVPRPVQIEQGLTVTYAGGSSYVVQPITDAQFASITYKATTGRPEAFQYTSGVPGQIEFYPVPDAPYTVAVPVEMPLSYFVAYDQEITVPSGIEAALSWSLAEYLMPDYGRDLRSVISMAKRMRDQVKRRNVDNEFWDTSWGGVPNILNNAWRN